jgi:hypothetical protein
MQSDLYIGQEKPESTIIKKKKAIFEDVITTINNGFVALNNLP